ncbi:hypothetical protein TrRE_jg6116 [Triparma retinervis]|uniref:Uncharacterized protein n=1 Tax=Triparma retinervis TaxID=2557542 RepID=A0A9W6ZK95_9STRA|nr:hypothetical protein TrRE_jg6116 [Triparma retinervis]
MKEGEMKEGEMKEGEMKEGEMKEGEMKEGEMKEGKRGPRCVVGLQERNQTKVIVGATILNGIRTLGGGTESLTSYTFTQSCASNALESFRPVATPTTIASLYGVTLTYMFGVIINAAKLSSSNGLPTLLRGTTLEVIFQVVANLIIPTGLVHMLVHYSHEIMEKAGVGGTVGAWAPTR